MPDAAPPPKKDNAVPEFSYRLVIRPSGYREYHIERRGCRIAECDSLAESRFLIHVLNNTPDELLIAAHGKAAERRAA